MPTWTISAPKEFQESVKETAKKLGLSYGAYLRKAHQYYLKSLTDKDFERAKKLMELNESKERLSALRERERILLREKGYKNKNVLRVLEDIEDPEIRKEILAIAKQREEEANKILKVHEELNPTSKEESKPKFKTKAEKIKYFREKIGLTKESEEDRLRRLLRKEGRDEDNINDVVRYCKQYAEENNCSLMQAYKELMG